MCKTFITVFRIAIGIMLGHPSMSVASATEGSYDAMEVVTSYVNGNSPTMILSFDNNLDVCLALRTPGTLDDLRERGIDVTRSQLMLLDLWALIEIDDDGLMHFTLPVIDHTRSAELSDLADTLAEKLLSAAREHVDGFRRALVSSGWAESEYALIGSYVLDGVLWTALEKEGLVRDSDATSYESGSEYWSGVSWVTLAEVSQDLGTNSGALEGGTMHVAWSPASLRVQDPMWKKGRPEAIIALARGESVAESGAIDIFREMGLVDSRGLVTFPVIHAGSPACELGGTLARRIARQLARSPELQEMVDLIGAEDDSAALIMAHHWIYPAMLRKLEGEGLQRPAIFENGEASGLVQSVFVTLPGGDCASTGD